MHNNTHNNATIVIPRINAAVARQDALGDEYRVCRLVGLFPNLLLYTIRIGEQTHAVGDAVTKAVLVRPATPDMMSETAPSPNSWGEHA